MVIILNSLSDRLRFPLYSVLTRFCLVSSFGSYHSFIFQILVLVSMYYRSVMFPVLENWSYVGDIPWGLITSLSPAICSGGYPLCGSPPGVDSSTTVGTLVGGSGPWPYWLPHLCFLCLGLRVEDPHWRIG